MELTTQETEKFISELSPVKKRIALYMNAGFSKVDSAKKIAKENGSDFSTILSFATMVEKLAIKKGIVFSSKRKKPTYEPCTKENSAKNKVHKRVLEEVMYSKIKSGVVLTLSWINCILETLVNEKLNDLKFLSCEMDKDTFVDLEKFIEEKSLTFMKEPLRCKIGEIIKISAKNTFSHLFLDYCKGFELFKDEISIAIKNKIIVKDGIIWITVGSRSGKKGFKTEKEVLDLIEEVGGKDYKVEFKHGYRDSMPMFTVIIRRIA